MKKAKNKWTGMTYEIVSQTDKEVTLFRPVDFHGKKAGQFTVAKGDFNFNYFEIK